MRLYLLAVLVAGVAVLVAGVVVQPAFAQGGAVYRVPVSGVIELGLAPYVQRALRQADAAGARAVILDLETPGGRVDAAQQIVKAVTATRVPVHALVNTHAWSAGALIALAADSIYMIPGSSIGAATPVSGAGEKAPEKMVSAMRGEFRALAERRRLDPRLAEAMVDEDIAIPGVVETGKLLTLTAGEAVNLGVAAAEVEGFSGVLERLGLGDAEVITPSINWAEHLVRFLSHPLVAPLLLSIGVLGLMIEIKTPSFGFAGVTGLLALTAFFGSHLIVGLAGWEEIILLIAGLIALGIEVFVTPGFGVAGILSIVLIGAAVFLALIGHLPTWGDVARASGVLMTTTIIVIAAVYTLVRQLPASARWTGIFLKTAADKATGYVSAPARADLVGVEGVAVTDLHPSGIAIIAGERLDVVSEAGFTPKGARVRVVRSEGYRHVVAPV
ncbi:MAG: nodulation protein NfeD [Gemmatimonadetes bacterium]|nr:nodulation protein NfeD [Gemmatimonadota bacterium]